MLRIFLLHSLFSFPSLNFFRKHYQNGLKFQTEAPLSLWPWPILNKQRSKQLCNSVNNTNLRPKCVQKQVGRSGDLHVNTLPRQVGAAFSRLPHFFNSIQSKTDPKNIEIRSLESFKTAAHATPSLVILSTYSLHRCSACSSFFFIGATHATTRHVNGKLGTSRCCHAHSNRNNCNV